MNPTQIHIHKTRAQEWEAFQKNRKAELDITYSDDHLNVNGFVYLDRPYALRIISTTQNVQEFEGIHRGLTSQYSEIQFKLDCHNTGKANITRKKFLLLVSGYKHLNGKYIYSGTINATMRDQLSALTDQFQDNAINAIEVKNDEVYIRIHELFQPKDLLIIDTRLKQQ